MIEISQEVCDKLIGTSNARHAIISAAPVQGDSYYGIALAANKNKWVTWQFHIEADVCCYWGHYYMDNKKDAWEDFTKRSGLKGNE